MTIVPDPDYPIHFSITGRAAHITAASPLGPRFDPTLTTAQRKGAENGIWLCADCADLIDKREGRGFAVELLRSWKARAEQEVANAALLGSVAQRPAWLNKMATPHYINLPRVLHFSNDTLSEGAARILQNGFPETGYIAPELYEAKLILRRLSIKAIDVEQLVRPEEQVDEGLVISFYRQCRTKNGANEDPAAVRTYSYDASPLIYCNSHGFKYVMPYDPIWVTSNTAVATMRSGSTTLAGMAIVKSVDAAAKTAICSPIAFGLPDLLGLFG